MNGNKNILSAVTAAQMREIDRISIDEIGIPAYVLMNNAGKAIADYIINRFNCRVSVFCGAGNNGGDGFTAAYYLSNAGFDVRLYLAGKKGKVSETSRIFMNLCENIGVKINEIEDSDAGSVKIDNGSIIIDALLGTGFEGIVRGIPQKLINIINSSVDCMVVSVDIPSGMNSDGELPAGDFVKADITVTIGLPKISLVTYPCREYCGQVIVEDIGFPSYLTAPEKIKSVLITEKLLKSFNIQKDLPDTHKGERGHSLLIGGFKGMEGAALLAASAFFKTGCGLLTILTTAESRNILAGVVPEAMTLSLPDDPFSDEFKNLIESGSYRSVVIGPGLGRTIYSEKIFTNFIKYSAISKIKRVLIDGDGLFHLAEYIKNNKLPSNVEFIITPHFMEASRLSGLTVSELKHNRFTSCKNLTHLTGCVTVLKGPSTIISDGDYTYINTTGNSGLATGGSGDVLSGIIGALMNRELTIIQSAAAGVFIHGLAADIFSEKTIAATMSASDIVNNIRSAISNGTKCNE